MFLVRGPLFHKGLRNDHILFLLLSLPWKQSLKEKWENMVGKSCVLCFLRSQSLFILVCQVGENWAGKLSLVWEKQTRTFTSDNECCPCHNNYIGGHKGRSGKFHSITHSQKWLEKKMLHVCMYLYMMIKPKKENKQKMESSLIM